MAGLLSAYTSFLEKSSGCGGRGGQHTCRQLVNSPPGAKPDICGVPSAGLAHCRVEADDPIVKLAACCAPAAFIALGAIGAGDAGVVHTHLFSHLLFLLFICDERYKDAVDQPLLVFVDDGRITAVAISGAGDRAVGNDAGLAGQGQLAALAVPGRTKVPRRRVGAVEDVVILIVGGLLR